jgi:large subunit ribosomal protein L18
MQRKIKEQRREARRRRTRGKIKGTKEVPRLSVFRSLKHISVQLIDDGNGKTLLGLSDKDLSGKFKNKVEMSQALGKKAGEDALKKGIKKVVFDKSGYRYIGKVQAVADGARSAGLKF